MRADATSSCYWCNGIGHTCSERSGLQHGRGFKAVPWVIIQAKEPIVTHAHPLSAGAMSCILSYLGQAPTSAGAISKDLGSRTSELLATLGDLSPAAQFALSRDRVCMNQIDDLAS